MVNQFVSEKTNNKLLQRVYAWMFVGLSITAIVSYFLSKNPVIVQNIFIKHSSLIFILFIIQLLLVGSLAFFIQKMPTPLAIITFIAYAILNGVTLTGIFLVYTQSSIAITFAVTAGMFLFMALYGFFTHTDLSGMRNFLLMGVVGLLIALFINYFLKSTKFDYVISAIGIIIFSLLTAYDVQRIKNIGNQLAAQGESFAKISILGALTLYLDFLNLFLYLLRFLGQRQDR